MATAEPWPETRAGVVAGATPSRRAVVLSFSIHSWTLCTCWNDNKATTTTITRQQKQQKSFACRHKLLENAAKLICNWRIRNQTEGGRERIKRERDITVDNVMASLSTYVLREMATDLPPRNSRDPPGKLSSVHIWEALAPPSWFW